MPEPRPLTRRSLVAGAAGAGAAAALAATPLGALAASRPRRRVRDPLVRDGAFDCGVASGFPGRRDITLWTHVDGVGGNGRIRLEVATDPGFRDVVVARDVRVAAVRDHTARTRVTKGLKPGEQYWYRFATRHVDSPVGRFRTFRPADSREPVRIGYFSCQDRQAGYYPAHRSLAHEDDLDLVVCLGDYVYEKTYYPGPAARKDTTGGRYDPSDPAYVVTLDEWRAKYRLYKTDPDLQAMHAAHPYVSIWDDHEVEDNYAGDHRDPAKTDRLAYSFADRRRNGYLAFFEYMPRVRMKPVSTQVYGSIPINRTAELLLLDERQYRDPQPCGDTFLQPCADTDTPGRTFLGARQKAWFKDALASSQATWKLVANGLMMMSLDSVPGVPVNLDSWDGYAAERREVLEHALAHGVEDLAFLTGDIHSFFAGQVTTTGRAGGRPAGTEFVGGSVTSLGLEHILEAAGPLVPSVPTVLVESNPHLRFANLDRRGYAVLEAQPDHLRVDFRAPETTQVPDSPVRTLASFRVASGTPVVERLD